MSATNGSFSQQEQYKSTAEQYATTSGSGEISSGNANGNGEKDLSKDEIGWFFVEQYYTTLSKSPEKLHLFYNKRSQFVSGLEAEVSPVSVGRAAIQERIRSLDFQECKVRVLNVDSQASDGNIVIQVIGESSNKSSDVKKFVQTFILAEQPNGYFILNDILRHISEEGEEVIEGAVDEEESAATTGHEQLAEGVEMPKAQTTVDEQVPGTLDTEIIDKKLEETLEASAVPTASAVTNGHSAKEVDVAAEAPVAATKTEELLTPEAVEKDIEEEDTKEPEKPQDPVPTPALSRLPSSVKAAPAAPAKPMSWANRVAATAAAAAPRPAVPAPKAAAPTSAQPRAPAATQAAPAATPAAAPAATANKENEAPSQGSGWQSVGSEHSKKQKAPQAASSPVEKEGTMGYVRNVTEGVKAEDLKAALSKFGELVYFDINRQKNCAFVEFATIAGYQAAFSANPHDIDGESISVEPRRPKSSAYGGAGYSGGRGGINNNNRGRGGLEQGRPGSQRGRGDFGANRGRGGATRGRGGAAQPTSA